jgi:hypothetical protein
LVKQWLEEMEVPAINEGYVDRRPLEKLGGVKSPKPSSDDDDVRASW